jgi:hypothetical protein
VCATSADVVVRVDARSRPGPGYVASCAARLAADPEVGVVGGVQRPAVHGGTVRARGIARALRNPWVLGGARYRREGAHGPADTVYLGAFRRTELLALGGYDERLDANEDFELCARYRRAGRTVWLEAGAVVDYEPRTRLVDVARQYRAFGAAKARYWALTGRGPDARQAVALTAAALGAAAAVFACARPRRLPVLAAAGIGALAAADHLADPHEPDPWVRAHALVASATVVGSWLWGVARGGAAQVMSSMRCNATRAHSATRASTEI